MAQFQAGQVANVAKQLFKANAICLPQRFSGFGPQAPFGAQDQKVPDAAALFRSASTLSYHVDTHTAISKNVEELIDAVCDGIGQAFGNFQSSAKFVGVLINGPVGMALPGSMVAALTMMGPALFGRVKMHGKQPSFIQYVRSITFAIGTAFTAWHTGYSCVLSYPSGAACVATMVPSPNIPLPVAAGFSPGDALMTPAVLKGLMLANHGVPGNHTLQIFDAIANAFCMQFMQWKGTTMIQNVTGMGGVAPVPPLPPAPVVMATGLGGMLQ